MSMPMLLICFAMGVIGMYLNLTAVLDAFEMKDAMSFLYHIVFYTLSTAATGSFAGFIGMRILGPHEERGVYGE